MNEFSIIAESFAEECVRLSADIARLAADIARLVEDLLEALIEPIMELTSSFFDLAFASIKVDMPKLYFSRTQYKTKPRPPLKILPRYIEPFHVVRRCARSQC